MHIDMEPTNTREIDHEGAMAKADLYKLANYSLKLFKMLDENTQLEGWVQAKITKAADYIASVYHYLEYEMKFSEYGKAIDDSEMYTMEQKQVLKAKLNEAKEKVKELKKAQADKLKKKEKKDDKEELKEASGVRATDKKKGAVTKSEKAQYFAKTTSKDGKTTKGSTHEAGEGETEGDVRDRVERDAKSKGETVDSFRKKEFSEGKKPDFLDMDKDGNKKEPMKKAVADKKAGPKKGVNPFAKKVDEATKAKKDYDGDGKVETGKDEYLGSKIAAAKKAGKLKEGTKMCSECEMPMAECSCKVKESTGDYSAKKAAAGKDIGKPGKNFAKIEKSAGGGEKGAKIAGAVLAKLRKG